MATNGVPKSLDYRPKLNEGPKLSELTNDKLVSEALKSKVKAAKNINSEEAQLHKGVKDKKLSTEKRVHEDERIIQRRINRAQRVKYKVTGWI